MINNNFNWEKIGFIYKPKNESDLWLSHSMAPAPIIINNSTIRIFMGGWDSNQVSRIYFIDVDSDNPRNVKKIAQLPILEVGEDGCFDDNGVFPAHVYRHGEYIYLYYTGFQKLKKIAFSNFGGLAISRDNGDTFERVSKAPVMDRQDEGLYTRAGTSILVKNRVFHTCYSVGNSWMFVKGKERPVYSVNYIVSKDGKSFGNLGKEIISIDPNVEHGLGRPQICEFKDFILVFYTRRFINHKYGMGVALSSDFKNWERIDHWLDPISHGPHGDFDSDMVYFPAFIDTGKNQFLFYNGNGYGKDGFGFAQLKRKNN